MNTLAYFIIILLIFTFIGFVTFYDIYKSISDIQNKLDVLKSKALSCDDCDVLKIWNEVNDITKDCLSKLKLGKLKIFFLKR